MLGGTSVLSKGAPVDICWKEVISCLLVSNVTLFRPCLGSCSPTSIGGSLLAWVEASLAKVILSDLVVCQILSDSMH